MNPPGGPLRPFPNRPGFRCIGRDVTRRGRELRCHPSSSACFIFWPIPHSSRKCSTLSAQMDPCGLDIQRHRNQSHPHRSRRPAGRLQLLFEHIDITHDLFMVFAFEMNGSRRTLSPIQLHQIRPQQGLTLRLGSLAEYSRRSTQVGVGSIEVSRNSSFPGIFFAMLNWPPISVSASKRVTACPRSAHGGK